MNYSFHTKEIAEALASLFSSRLTSSLGLKICKRGWLRQLPMADSLSDWLNILFVRATGFTGVSPASIQQTAQVTYTFDVWYITQRADGEESDDRLQDAMDSIAACLCNTDWLHGDLDGADGCFITLATPGELDLDNPLEELLDTEEWRLMSGRLRVTVQALESKV